MLYALVAQAGAWSVGELVKWIIIVAALVAVLFVIVRAMGIQIPPWIITICWICLAAVIGIIAVRFLLSL